MFPLKKYNHNVPSPYVDPGGFGTPRRHDVHTGVDLYCENGDDVLAIEDGVVVDIVKFTGFDESPWWEDTWAIVIYGNSGYILYGELTTKLKIADYVKEGDIIGNVKRVLKVDKGKNPPSMLHMELYSEYSEPVWWKDEQPKELKNITDLLCKQLIN
jgi:murein DD-endopeptidase MepM/ murein hydrolase activator NlpD